MFRIKKMHFMSTVTIMCLAWRKQKWLGTVLNSMFTYLLKSDVTTHYSENHCCASLLANVCLNTLSKMFTPCWITHTLTTKPCAPRRIQSAVRSVRTKKIVENVVQANQILELQMSIHAYAHSQTLRFCFV